MNGSGSRSSQGRGRCGIDLIGGGVPFPSGEDPLRLKCGGVVYLVGGKLQIRPRRPEGKHPFAQPFFLSSLLHEVGNRWGKGLLGVGLDFLSH